MREDGEELDARFGAGPLNAGAIVRVRDLIVCAGDPSLDVPIEEVYAHPPIGWGHHPGVDDERFGETVEVIDLGGAIIIEELDRDTAELVMNACTPRGHYFVPVRQFGQRYSFVKEVLLDELESVALPGTPTAPWTTRSPSSHLVRDNGYSTQYGVTCQSGRPTWAMRSPPRFCSMSPRTAAGSAPPTAAS